MKTAPRVTSRKRINAQLTQPCDQLSSSLNNLKRKRAKGEKAKEGTFSLRIFSIFAFSPLLFSIRGVAGLVPEAEAAQKDRDLGVSQGLQLFRHLQGRVAGRLAAVDHEVPVFGHRGQPRFPAGLEAVRGQGDGPGEVQLGILVG